MKGRENLVLPLLIMGILSVIGGITGLRLPETLHYKLPQTVEEGEEFGKNWTMTDCLNCIPKKYCFIFLWFVKLNLKKLFFKNIHLNFQI